MTLPTSSLAFAAGAGVLLLAAAVSDLRRFTIPNWICLALVVLYALRGATALWAGAAPAAWAFPVVPAFVVLAAGAAAFNRGWLGGGDVKLLAAAALWMPAGQVFDFLTLVALLGGGLAAVVLAITRLRPAAAGTAGVPGVRLPYGVAISGAAILMLIDVSRLQAGG